MLKYLTVRNFRQHREATFHFTPGLNVIRGANEAGKTTLYEAIGYCLGGANSLREPLEDVASWGQPSTAIFAELCFEHEGVEYKVKRSAAGAELTYGDQAVTGQREVTRFVEGLFQAPVATMNKVQLANQGKLRGALEGGPTEANDLIEELANMEQLDDLIESIQTKRPCGSTKTIEAMIAAHSIAAERPPEPDQGPVQAAAANVLQKRDALKSLEVGHSPESLQLWQRSVLDFEQKALAEANRKSELAKLEAILAKPVELPAVSAERLAELEEAATNWSALSHLYQESQRPVPAVPHIWAGNRASFDAEVASLKAEKTRLNAALSTAKEQIAATKAQVISATVCGLCNKDLRDVPEVQSTNKALHEKLSTLETEVGVILLALAGVESTLATLALIAKSASDVALLFKAPYWSLPDDQVPPNPRWVGKTPVDPGPQPDTSKFGIYRRDIQNYVAEKRKCSELEEKRSELLVPIPLPDVSEQRAKIEAYTSVEAKIRQTRLEIEALEKVLSDATQVVAKQVAAVQAWEAGEVARKLALQQAKDNLKEVEFWNTLVTKIRAAKPVIATNLWNYVLATVSDYLSRIRQEPSIVTKKNKQFLVNGRSVKGYAGSALDSLGLSIRLALSRTFLPAVGFMLLDEPAAACAEDREMAMLGLLSSVEVEQVLLITHSNLADALAANLIQL